jgi:hypothetical protein
MSQSTNAELSPAGKRLLIVTMHPRAETLYPSPFTFAIQPAKSNIVAVPIGRSLSCSPIHQYIALIDQKQGNRQGKTGKTEKLVPQLQIPPAHPLTCSGFERRIKGHTGEVEQHQTPSEPVAQSKPVDETKRPSDATGANMTPETTNHAASTGDTSADTNHAQGKEQSEKNTVGDGRGISTADVEAIIVGVVLLALVVTCVIHAAGQCSCM